MKEVCNKEVCTGCGLCIIVCNKKAISFYNGKLGHLYPVIDSNNCSNCGLCAKMCPANNKYQSLVYPLTSYAAFSRDMDDYKSSTSGAVASVLSNYVIDQEGVVYGCSICNINSNTIDVKHIRVTSKNNLFRLKGSKYVQSRIVEILPLLREDVKNGKKVLFIGTPCQTAAVRSLFPKNPKNLYVVDIICHGVPSLEILQKHIKDKIGGRDIDNIRFRNNSLYEMQFLLQDRILYKSNLFEERYKDEYFNAFFDGYTFRDSCYQCKYARNERVSDVTIGDFWRLGESIDTTTILPHNYGVSVVLPITNKGIELIDSVKSKLNIYERPIVEAIHGNDQLREPKGICNRARLFRIFSKVLRFNVAYKLSIIDINFRNALRRIIFSKD